MSRQSEAVNTLIGWLEGRAKAYELDAEHLTRQRAWNSAPSIARLHNPTQLRAISGELRQVVIDLLDQFGDAS